MKVVFRRTLIAGLTSVLALSLCLAKKKDEPKDQPKPVAAASAEPGVIAVVGDVKITEQDLKNSLPPANQKAFEGAVQRISDMEKQAMQVVFADRYAQEQATSKKMSVDDYYKAEIETNRDGFPDEFKSQIAQAKGQLYEGKRSILDDLVGKKLEENAAKAKGVTLDAYIREEVTDKIEPVTQAEIDQYYTANQRQFGQQTKDAVTPQITDMIKRGKEAQKRNELRASLRTGTTVRTFLEVPRIPVTSDDDPVRGSKTAPVQIVMWSDFECPFCSRVETTLKQIVDKYGDKVAITFRDYPLPFHQNAEKAAEAANCAHAQGKYWEFHDALFSNQSQLGMDALKKTAETIGLDMTAFNKCVESGEMKAEIEKDMAAGQSFGVNGTPASFVNGRLSWAERSRSRTLRGGSTMSCRSREFRFPQQRPRPRPSRSRSFRLEARLSKGRTVRNAPFESPRGQGAEASCPRDVWGACRGRGVLGERAALGGLTPPGVDQRRSDADVVPAGRSSGSAAGFRDAVIRRRESLHGRLRPPART
jgi:2-hydroxychromene-2-carboxylate isomerase